MTSCAHVDMTEALALGLLERAADRDGVARARAHLAECAECRADYDLFAAERELFAARAPYHAKVAPPPRSPSLAFVASTARAVPWRASVHHHMKGVVAALACAAAIVCVAKLEHGLEPYAPRVAKDPSMPLRADEPLACAAPVSGFAFTPTDQLTCRSTSPRACEDEPLASYAR